MARIEKTVFISYRRTDVYAALAVYENLKNHGFDVFFDYRSISSGDFEQIITANIKARAHFLLILTPTALDRCNEPGDWLRREIETAIDEKRNIVPLFFKGFKFGGFSKPKIFKWLRLGKRDVLPDNLKSLSRYNGLNVHEDYFEEAMDRLRTEYLNNPLDTVLHPVSTEVLKIVKEEQIAADDALKHKDIFKQPRKEINWRDVLRPIGIFTLLALFIWGGISLWNNLPSAILEPTQTSQPTATRTNKPVVTNSPSPTQTSVPPTPTLDTGSTMIGKDGMTLLYVPAGKFTMGSDADDALAECQKFKSDCKRDWFTNEQPPHNVDLDAFWIDRTEVTNAMYAECVDAGICDLPSQTGSYTSDSYFRHINFVDYPVIYIDWYMARTYCEWVGRRLPTEAEWEKTARGSNANIYPWGNDFDGNLVNFCDTNCSIDEEKNGSYDDGFAETSPVGNYSNGASPYGALDMAGNVWEWVEDWYMAYPGNSVNSYYYGATFKVLRGGAWSYDGDVVRSASRVGIKFPHLSSHDVGFRCAMDGP